MGSQVFRHIIFDFKVMDFHSYFGEASTQSTSASASASASRFDSDSEDESEIESLELEVSPPKKQCTSTVRCFQT